MVHVRGFPPGRALTRADLEAMPHDGHRYELLDGVLVVSPSPRPVHQRAVLRVISALEPACPDSHEVLPAPVDVVLAEDTVTGLTRGGSLHDRFLQLVGASDAGGAGLSWLG